MQDFEFHRPGSVDDAVGAHGKADEGKFIAGGQSLLPLMKLDLAAPSDLISLSGLKELRGVKVDGSTVVIGATTTHAEVEASSDVRKHIPALAALAARIGDPQVRNRGTLGGSIAHNDPAADYPAALVALNATVETNKRSIGADDFFTGMFQTALEEGELIESVRFPVPEKAAYVKMPNPASKFAIVGVMVAKGSGGVRVAVVGAGTNVFRVEAMEAALAKSFEPAAIEGITVPADDLVTDVTASAEYRAHLVNVVARRAVAAC